MRPGLFFVQNYQINSQSLLICIYSKQKLQQSVRWAAQEHQNNYELFWPHVAGLFFVQNYQINSQASFLNKTDHFTQYIFNQI
jgi:hypothetical protein